jgi:ATP-dependent helicase/DNAse subunit B
MSLQKGNIDINPYLRSSSTPCTYCPYGSICRFTSGTGSYNELENLDKEEAWAFMKGEVDRVDQ